MKVGFDISQTAHIGGVSVYTENLTMELSKLKDLDLVFFYSSLRKPYHGTLKNVKQFFLPPTLFEILFNRIRVLPIESFIGEVDIFHSSDWIQPPTRAKKVTTYHDVIPLKYPQWSHPKIVAVHKKRLEIVEKEIDMVIAVSKSTKKDLLEISKIPAEKIVVIYEGVSEIFKPQSDEDIEDFRKKNNLPKEFLLSIGGVGKRRNLERIKQASKDFNLVIMGETIKNLKYYELPLLYASAKALIYPSFYEGFGLPILEAFACGIPVITSNISSMPEVAGEAAIYVDPENTEELAKKIKLIVEDDSKRKELINRGFERVKLFSWQKCAQETAKVYSKLMNL
ncbi:glycosyltransferase family 4 protein [Candidatus Daviesbacteria bacterium]|nr:glycosyltransferase family 4 protein [Candidatus Daviesbacteria bacterium]